MAFSQILAIRRWFNQLQLFLDKSGLNTHKKMGNWIESHDYRPNLYKQCTDKMLICVFLILLLSVPNHTTLEPEIDVDPWINVASGKFANLCSKIQVF